MPSQSLEQQPPRVFTQARLALILLLSINLLNYVDRQILAAVEKPIGDEFSVSSYATGWLSSAFLLAYLVFSPMFGVLADRMRRWVIIGVGVIFWSLASGGTGAAHTFTMLIIMRLLIGVGEAAYGPVAPTLIADMYPIASRGKMLAWFYAAIPVGSALGYIIGGAAHSHWHAAFYATLPPGILLGIFCLFMRDPPREGVAARRRPTFADYLHLMKIKSYTINTAAMTAMTFALGSIAYFMLRYLEEVRHLDPKSASPKFGAIAALAGLLGTIAGGIVGDRLRSRIPGSYIFDSALGMLLGCPLLLLMLVTPFPACWAVIFAAVFCLFLNTGPSNAIIANVVPDNVRATAFALNILIIHLFGDALSPPLIGWIAHRHGMSTAFAIDALPILAGAILWIVGMPYLLSETVAAMKS
ncbi:MAG TPA: MFS transporter [Tepidisphaeraceae bacterium]